MARIKGMIDVGSNNYEVKVGRPMDARASVPTQADLYLEDSWSKLAIYNGMIVSVIATGEVFVLRDKSNFTLTESWKKLLQEGDVESNGSGLESELVEALPEAGVENTLYFLKSTSDGTNKYLEYMWINGAWELVGGTPADMSLYYTKEEVNGLIADKADKSYVDEQVAALDDKIEAIEIPSIEGLATQAEVDEVRGLIPSTDGLATKEEVAAVEAKVDAIQIPSIENLATKDELQVVENKIPSTAGLITKDVNNLTYYYDKATVDQKLADVAAGGEVDLGGYAKTEDVDAALATKAEKSYVDEQVGVVEGKIPTIDHLATKDELDAVEAKIDEIEIPSIEGLATQASVNAIEAKVDAIQVPTIDHLATKDELDAVESKVDEIKVPTIDHLATQESLDAVEAKVDAIKIPTTDHLAEKSAVESLSSEVDAIQANYTTTESATQIAQNVTTAALSGYAKSTDIPTLVAGNIPTNVVRRDELADMATKTEVSATYATKDSVSSTYVTKAAYNEFVAGAATDAEVASAVSAAKSELGGRITTLEGAGYITKDVNNLTNYSKSSEIASTYATKSELQDIADIFQGADGESVSLSDYATTKYVDAEILEHKSSTYTKEETEGKIAEAVSGDKVAVLDASGKIDDDVLPGIVVNAITWGSI